MFLISFYYLVELWITTAVRDTSISDLDEDVYFMSVLFYLSQGAGHMPREPVYVFL